MVSAVGSEWTPPAACTEEKDTTRQGFRGSASHAGCGPGSHPSPREEATAFNEPGRDKRESSSCLWFPWELEGMSRKRPLSLLSWERAGGGFSPLSRERILFPSLPLPPSPSTPIHSAAHQFSGQLWLAVWAFLSAHN